MSETAAARPVPAPNDTTAPFWEAAADHVLTLARCGECATLTLPPEPVCTACGGTEREITFEPVGGSGVIRSWTIVRRSFLPGFDDDVPFVLVDVALDAQPDVRLIGRLLDGVDAPLALELAVELAWDDIADDVSLPAFRLAA